MLRKMIFVQIKAIKYKSYQIFIIFWVISLVRGQSCPPKDSDMKPISNFLLSKLTEIRKYKPGTNTKDAEWAIYRVVKDVSTNNKFAPCNNGFPWSQIEEDSNQIKEECYKPSDMTVTKNQKDLFECSKKFYPQFIIRYGKQGLDSCTCFAKYILPNWKSRYQKYANDYVEEFKTLKHRKLSVAKIRGN